MDFIAHPILLAVTKISAVLITLNEERRVAAALESVRFCDEVLVLDAGSTDRTREVASGFGARVETRAWEGFTAQRNHAVAAAHHDWVLAVDADERVTPPLAAEIEALRASGFAHAGYRIPRVAFYLGKWIRGTDWYPDPQLRLFDRRRGRWTGGLIHESVQVDGPVGRLNHELEHHTYDDISDHLSTIDRYTTLWAAQAHADGKRAGVLDGCVASTWAFIRNYVVRRGFLLGEAGLTVSTLNAYYTYAKMAKLRELARAAMPPEA
jgi:glycosyltransferase involved in cell wall biosynthesis